MEAKNILLIGGTGGVGSKLYDSLWKNLNGTYSLFSFGSKLCDVTDSNEVKLAFMEHEPDIIIYLSVINHDGLIHKQSQQNIDEMLNVNVRGFLNVLGWSNEHMRTKKYGRVIYISSVLSDRPIPGTGMYSATKSFCETIVKTYALENVKYGITANSIRLGYFEGGLSDNVPENIMEKVIQKIPAKRLGKSDELSSLVNLLINNEYINGANISLTSGYENV